MDEFPVISITINEWQISYRRPESKGKLPVFVLLHGWTGDENSMWIFTRNLPKEALYIAPRGYYPTPIGGFGWYPSKTEFWPKIDDFIKSATELNKLLGEINFPRGDFSGLHLIGYSQGAALAFSFACLFPDRIRTVASLSGFLPEGLDKLAVRRGLIGKSIFMAHGSRDELVPIVRARSAVEIIETAGGKVIFCEDDVGHKLSASCFRGLEAFISGSVGR